MASFLLSKKILTLGIKDDPQPHPKALQLQRMIRYTATLFVQVGPASIHTQKSHSIISSSLVMKVVILDGVLATGKLQELPTGFVFVLKGTYYAVRMVKAYNKHGQSLK